MGHGLCSDPARGAGAPSADRTHPFPFPTPVRREGLDGNRAYPEGCAAEQRRKSGMARRVALVRLAPLAHILSPPVAGA